jgi:hypothetical protein
MRVVAMLACPSHSCTLAMSAWWSRALVAAVARSEGGDLETELRGIGPDERIDAVWRDGFVEPAVAVVADRPEQGAVLVRAIPGGLEVIVNEGVSARVQRQIACLLALA